MKPLHVLSGLFLVVMMYSCGSGQSTAETPQQRAALDTLVQQKEFRVENQWAIPTMSSSMVQIANSGLMGPGNNAQRVNLIGNSNYLEVKGDSVKAYLPFFGERQMGGGYNTDDEAIQFNQKVAEMDMDYIASKKKHRIKFKANNGTESFDVTLEVFNNYKTSLIVNSSERDLIRYEGTVAPLLEKDNE